MENYKKEYIKHRTDMKREFKRIGRNFLRWLKKNGIDFDELDSYEERINLGLLAGEYIVIYLNPDHGSVAITGFIPFERAYDEYCNENDIKWKEFDPQKLTDEEYGKIKDAYKGYVQQLVDGINENESMQKVISYFKKEKSVISIYIDPVEGDSIDIYTSKRKDTAKIVKRLAFLLAKIEEKDDRFKEGLLAGELAKDMFG